MNHLVFLVRQDADLRPRMLPEIKTISEKGKEIIGNFAKEGIIVYKSPLHGIALYPFLIQRAVGESEQAYFVYKDSRTSIDAYVVGRDLTTHDDLWGYEKTLPEDWKTKTPRLLFP
jgi:hypothetical protein